MSSGYEYQASDHTASVRAEPIGDLTQSGEVRLTITRGDNEVTVTLWEEDWHALYDAGLGRA